MALSDYALCGQCNKKLVYEGENSPVQGDDPIYCSQCFDKWKFLAGKLHKVMELLWVNNTTENRQKFFKAMTKAREAGL